MDDMQELVSIEAIERWFAWMALAGPPIGLLFGGLIGRRLGDARRSAVRGLLVGLLGPANWLLWRMYSALTDHCGLDSVTNLLVNLTIFLAIGLGTGFVYGMSLRRRAMSPAAGVRGFETIAAKEPAAQQTVPDVRNGSVGTSPGSKQPLDADGGGHG